MYMKEQKEDNAQAVYWYKKAAEKGNANSQYALGWMFENGEGVIKNLALAFDWYRKQRFYDPRRSMAIRAWTEGDIRLALRLLKWAQPKQNKKNSFLINQITLLLIWPQRKKI